MSTQTIINDSYSIGHPVRDVAVVGLVNDSGCLLMVKTNKLQDAWQPVGGGVEGTESPSEALIREVREELAIHINPSRSVLNTVFPYDFGKGSVHFFTIPIDNSLVDSIAVDSREIAEIKWFSLDELVSIPCYPATHLYIKMFIEYMRLNIQKDKNSRQNY